jgi:CRISPR type IV-associated protein Csf3
VDTVTGPQWTPVRVEARFSEAVIGLPKDPMHLDGPLAWSAYQDALMAGDPGTLRLPPMREWAHDFVLPLAVWTAPCTRSDPDPRLLAADGMSAWGWACSQARYRVLRHTVAHVRRRPPNDQMAYWTSAERYHPALGPRRAANIQHQGVWVDTVRWWALADPGRLRQLLDRVTHVGRLARQGWGRVMSWTVVDDPAAVKLWRARWFPGVGGEPQTVRAPYYHESRRMPCVLDGKGGW